MILTVKTQNLQQKIVCNDPIKFLTKSVESGICDYSDAYILVTGNIAVTRTIAVPTGSPTGTQLQRKQQLDAATQVAFKNCAPFEKCSTEIDGVLLMKQMLLILQCQCTI